MLKNKLLSAMGGAPANYIEDVFSTWLYTGNGSTQTITNGIDLAGKGGLVWQKSRTNIDSHRWNDTARASFSQFLDSASTNGTLNLGASFTKLGDGFRMNNSGTGWNESGTNYASWTFRKHPKFYTQGTYTGTGVARTIAHDLGAVPGCIIVKRTDAGGDNWLVYHRSLGATKGMKLNLTDAQDTVSVYWNNTEPTATEFTVGSGGDVNASGGTYVYYAFAHNAGGFGLSGTDNVISCGSWTVSGSVGSVNLGYEPQWVLAKRTDSTGNWFIFDTMRGFTANQPNGNTWLAANTSNAENTGTSFPGAINSTGWSSTAASGIVDGTYIYIAIRRGPMKTPTSGTSVFDIDTRYSANDGNNPSYRSDFPVDFGLARDVDTANAMAAWSRLTGLVAMYTTSTAEEAAYACENDYMNGWGETLAVDATKYSWMFRRAPGFFDEVCYTGNGTTQNISHNLGAVPELMIAKKRNAAGAWVVYTATTGNAAILELSTTGAVQTSAPQWNNTTPTASVFSLGTSSSANASGSTYVAYLFASCPGVQSIQSYVGDGTTGRTINCGFTGGARFVCIKATSTTGSWWTFDSARGIVTNNDPALQLNSTAAEVTSADAVDTAASGFIVNQEATCSLNASGVTYLVWAIA